MHSFLVISFTLKNLCTQHHITLHGDVELLQFIMQLIRKETHSYDRVYKCLNGTAQLLTPCRHLTTFLVQRSYLDLVI